MHHENEQTDYKEKGPTRWVHAAQDGAHVADHWARHVVTAYPLLAVGGAVLMGFVMGKLISRR